jgi:2-oxoglutarate ferredoxin oxidoreductase subunit beta
MAEIQGMKKIYSRPESLREKQVHYCPGCSHGLVHKLIAEIFDEEGLREKSVGVAPVGCSVFAYEYFNCDFSQAPHGRAPAVATGIKRSRPDLNVFTYQGDGDLAAIGTAEIIHAANRGENITVVFINNAIYGMTGGQMAPTSLIGQKTQTSPYGRDAKDMGYPIRVCELLSSLGGVKYLARTTVKDFKNIMKTKKALKKAFDIQQKGLGFSLVEILSVCPTNWGKTPVESYKWLEENMEPYFPLGEFVTPDKEEK